MSYFYVFLQSNLLEIPIYLLLLKGGWRRTEFVTVMNSVTHPIVFFGFMNLPLNYLSNILLAESFAIGVETAVLAFYAGVRAPKAFVASFIANLVSWQFAPVLTYLFFG